MTLAAGLLGGLAFGLYQAIGTYIKATPTKDDDTKWTAFQNHWAVKFFFKLVPVKDQKAGGE